MKKQIFFFWEGNTLPFMRFMSIHSFIKHNPSWKVFLIRKDTKGLCRWNSGENPTSLEDNTNNYFKELEELPVTILSLENDFSFIYDIDSNISCVHAKDILNWHLLAKEGGVVSDMDILYIKSISNIYEEYIKENATVGIISFKNFPKKNYMPVSFMMGGPNTFFEDVYNLALKQYNPSIYECGGTLCLPAQTLEEIKKMYPKEIFYHLNEHSVFPFTHVNLWKAYNLMHKEDAVAQIPVDTIGIHWYGGNPMSINHTNKNNTICKLIQYP